MKNQKGITLIALVITIIVLLILAGVTISLTVGKNGALSKARSAVTKNDIASASEELNIAASDASMAFMEAWSTNQHANALDYFGKTAAGNAYSTNCSKASDVALALDETAKKVYVKYTTKSNIDIYFTIEVTEDDSFVISDGYSEDDKTAETEVAKYKAMTNFVSAKAQPGVPVPADTPDKPATSEDDG